MNNENFTTTILVDKSEKEIFNAINNVNEWWGGLWSGEVEGITDKLGAEFNYSVPETHYSKQKIVELVPNKKVVWEIVESELTFLKTRNEWDNTKIIFEILKKDEGTEVRFTHEGLNPSFECYKQCTQGWTTFINGRLQNYIKTGNPDSKIATPLSDQKLA